MPDLFAEVLCRASYEGVQFPVSNAPTDGGHDSVEHTAYLRRGADNEPTGLRAYRGTMTVPMVNGLRGLPDLFPGKYHELIAKFESTPIGQLTHPTKGTFTALIERWPEALTPQNRSGVMLEIHWKEHNGQALVLKSQSRTDTPTAAQTQAQSCDGAMAAVSPAVPYTPVYPVFVAQLAFLEAAYRSYAQISAAINLMLTVVNYNLALPGFASALAHDAVASLVALRATTYQLFDRYVGTQGRARLYAVPRMAPVFQIAYEVYGDSSKASLITAANALADPFYVPAGTVLTILPAA